MPGRGPHHPAHHGHKPRQRGLGLKIVGTAATGVAGQGRPMAGALQQHDQRDALPPGDVGDTPALPGGRRADRAPHGGEVLRAHCHRAVVDGADAGHESIGGHGSGQRADLGEGARVEQFAYAAPGIEATLRPGGRPACRPLPWPGPTVGGARSLRGWRPSRKRRSRRPDPQRLAAAGTFHGVHGSYPQLNRQHDTTHRANTLPIPRRTTYWPSAEP